MVPMLSLVYLFYFLMISWLLGKKRVDFMYLWRLSADFKKFWWSFTSLGKPKFEFESMSLVHFIIRLIAIMSTVPSVLICIYQAFIILKILGFFWPIQQYLSVSLKLYKNKIPDYIVYIAIILLCWHVNIDNDDHAKAEENKYRATMDSDLL